MGPAQTMLFEMHEDYDADGVLRLSLSGELDLSARSALEVRLQSLRAEGAALRLDLSSLEFVDSSGVRALIAGAEDAQADGWHLEVDPQVHPQVQRVVELVGAAAYLWPSGHSGVQGTDAPAPTKRAHESGDVRQPEKSMLK